MRWRYKLTKRSRWKYRLAEELKKLEKDLKGLHWDPAERDDVGFLDWIVSTSLLEVRIPYRDESEGWAARIAPWEFMLNSVNRRRGGTGDFSVIRHLERPRARKTVPSSISRVLYLECAPAELREHFSFNDERRRLHMRFPKAEVEELFSPTRDVLRRTVSTFKPHVIHVAGVDTHQARSLLEERWELPADWGLLDGTVLTDDEGWIDPVAAQDFAKLLNAGTRKPILVFCNFYHSASRIAALCVAGGAQYAIGYQDTVDDEIAETLFSEFYDAWRGADWCMLPAFVAAVGILRRSPQKLTGTGIVLWSAHSLLDAQSGGLAESKRKRAIRRQKPIGVKEAELEIEVIPNESVNYSMLHNASHGLFSKFAFHKFGDGALLDVNVNVEFHVGADSFPFRKTLSLVDPYTTIEEEIAVPLISDLMRSVQEPLKTSLYAEVMCQEEVLYRQTSRMTLLPVDEWRDDEENRRWLPSFVLPRDPAVEKIITTAQSHLMTLTDDRTRGFDGYQSVAVDDPESLDDLDFQVQAIWAALVHHYRVQYINPPPSYTASGQRLRTPTQVLRGGRGTCIDLAILLAACMEYVDIYPVVFLLEGHAFVGYWRSEEYYLEFTSPEEVEGGERDATREGTWGSEADWIVPRREYAEILRQIHSGRLYPIESVGLTDHGSFWRAVDEGVENLRDPAEFHSLVDIKRARAYQLTPLPIKEDSYGE
ncbi:MAG: transglutaminase domain-containing protein [bacterium]|nr:transglutaminase domain-containing protein [bacterium]